MEKKFSRYFSIYMLLSNKNVILTSLKIARVAGSLKCVFASIRQGERFIYPSWHPWR
jgi:hypothetical protein